SAQDFRYAALIIVIEAIMLGIVSDGKGTEQADRDRVLLMRMIKGSTAVFCICSLIVYFMLGFYKP
ncbi:MAG: hypothetical protein K6D90_07085, partial [Lachnospiraceae bacterium]|nr:hypothetical protein [Lachnospiraceae bacterium]